MASKPGTTLIWNTSAAGMTAPTGGQETNGVSDGDLLPAGLFDYLIYWPIQWIKYLNRGPTRKIGTTAGRGSNGGAVAGSYSEGAWSNAATADVFAWSLELAEGEKLTSASVRALPGGAGHMIMTVRKITDGDAAGATVLGTATSTGAVAETLTVSGMTEVITSSVLVQYIVRVTFATSTGQIVRGLSYSCESSA